LDPSDSRAWATALRDDQTAALSVDSLAERLREEDDDWVD
jgi:hypothetical protein